MNDDSDLEDGQEICPICDRLNEPGADDACEHFVGSAWDGMLVWGDGVERFGSLWSTLRSAVEERPELAGSLTAELAAVVGRREGNGRADISQELWDLSPSDALLQLIPVKSGPSVVTDGMLSGLGVSMYLRQPEDLAALNAALSAFVEKIGPQDGESQIRFT